MDDYDSDNNEEFVRKTNSYLKFKKKKYFELVQFVKDKMDIFMLPLLQEQQAMKDHVIAELASQDVVNSQFRN